jgi:hypothetical protein
MILPAVERQRSAFEALHKSSAELVRHSLSLAAEAERLHELVQTKGPPNEQYKEQRR